MTFATLSPFPVQRALGGAILLACIQGAAARPDVQHRLYLANDDHTDFMWSTDATSYQAIFVDLLDHHLALADQTASNPAPYRNRFNTDGSYWLWTYQRSKSPAQFDRLMARIKDGTIGSPLNTLVSTYGAQPAEAVLRGLYYAGRLERRYGVRFATANATENQTLPLGLASLFAGSGAAYHWRGICGCASQLDNKVMAERQHEVYWYTGHDGQRQLMKWYSLGPLNIGGYWEAGFPDQAIDWVDTDPGFVRRHVDPASKAPYTVTGLFGYGGDDLARKPGVKPPAPIAAAPGLQGVPSNAYTEHFHTIAQRHSSPARQVIVSNETDYFTDLEAHHGATLPKLSVTYGNEWDLYSASMAETSARVKRAVEKLRSAELLASLVSLQYAPFMDHHTGARDQAFTDLGLYWEHDWTADGPITRGQRAAWQNLLAASIDNYVDGLYADGIVRLGGMMPKGAAHERFFVLNPLGWQRTGAADYAYNGTDAITVRDVTSGAEVPHQIVDHKGARYLRILAANVPSAGYRMFEIVPGPATRFTAPAARVDGATIDNGQVRLTLAHDGAITSWIDRRHGASELAASIDGRALNDIAPGSDEGDALRLENSGPVSVTLRARSRAGLAHESAITLYRDSGRIDIDNEITANFRDNRYWGFSFALANPMVHSEEVGAINLNRRQGDGGDYADSHARYDHITLNHFADIGAGDAASSVGAMLSNPDLAFARLGRSTLHQLDTATPQINVLAGGQVDGPALGIQGQNGASYFLQRFALQARTGYDQAAAMRFALEHQNPLVTGKAIGASDAPYAASQYCLLQVSQPDVLLWALKPAEEGIGAGLVARLWNLASAPRSTAIRSTPGVRAAQRTTHIETDLAPVTLQTSNTINASFTREQMQTYRLQLATPAHNPTNKDQP